MGRTAQPAALRLIGGRGNGTDSGGRKVNPGTETS
jgi:phage terminase small subunit